MRSWLMTVFAIVLVAPAAAAPAQDFTFMSDNPSGSGAHSGTVTMTPTSTTDIYDIVWTIPEGSLKGVAAVHGAPDRLYVSYSLGDVPGLVVLSLGPDGIWRGTWYQSGKTGAEVWTPSR